MFPAEKVTHWDVGFRMGAELCRATTESGESKGGAHASARPHVRTTHWHHYWTGPAIRRNGSWCEVASSHAGQGREAGRSGSYRAHGEVAHKPA